VLTNIIGPVRKTATRFRRTRKQVAGLMDLQGSAIATALIHRSSKQIICFSRDHQPGTKSTPGQVFCGTKTSARQSCAVFQVVSPDNQRISALAVTLPLTFTDVHMRSQPSKGLSRKINKSWHKSPPLVSSLWIARQLCEETEVSVRVANPFLAASTIITESVGRGK
jgi:hypothetical protein